MVKLRTPLRPAYWSKAHSWLRIVFACILSFCCSSLRASLEVMQAEYISETDEVELTWNGEADAFGVEMSFDLLNWNTEVFTDERSARVPVDPDQPMFLRIAELPEAETLVSESPELLTMLDSIENQLSGVLEGEVDEENEAFADILRSYGELSNVEVVSDCVWAELPDGKVLTIINNRSFDSNPLSEAEIGLRPPTMASAPVEIETNNPRQAVTGPTRLPNSKKVYIASSNHVRLRMGPDLASWFREFGYDVVQTNASLLALWNVKEAGVFYFEGHGGFLPKLNETGLSVLVTDTTVSPKLSETMKSRIEGYAIVETRRDWLWQSYYMITSNFTSNPANMSFANNSLVFLNGCNGFPMSTAFGSNPLVLSWKNNTNDLAAYRAARYYFDRLLGANRGYHLLYSSEFKADPPQRAFNHTAVHLSMVLQGLHSTISLEENAISDPKGKDAKLFSSGNTTGFGLLAPSIERIFVEEAFEQLRIFGSFDPNVAAEVRIHTSGGVKKVTPSSVTTGMMVCELKATPENSSVEVQVVQRGHWE